MPNAHRITVFTAHYATALAAEVVKHPEDYAFPPERAPAVAARMTPSLARGDASLGPAAKRAARALGVHPTLGGIRAWLNDPAPLPGEVAATPEGATK